MLENTKKKASTPKITPVQLVFFGLLVAWMVVSNLKAFQGLDFWIQAIISIGFYIAIMLSAGQRGSVITLVREFIRIIGAKNTSDEKIVQLQNLLVAICQELGIFYEKELEKLNGYLTDQKDSQIADLKTEIELLRTQINSS